ncbi:caspase family protein [Actinomadura fulvescens]|uniref:Rho RNA-BD domain-containing protein n=1 Tax=Actinomadura fulvescens TaxID=46160 RepID=A0ABN3Q8H8_9ACTN
MGLPNPQRSRVVLLGASTYTDDRLPDLPVVDRTIRDLASILTEPGHGLIPQSNCTVMVDEGDIRKLGYRLRLAARQAEDLLFVYYTGHGLVGGKRHELYLALPDSDWAEPEFNSLEYDKLRSAVLDSPATTKVIILDCCFSGRAVSETMADPVAEVIGQIDVDGTYVLTSAPRDRLALILPGEEHPAFSGRFLRLLRLGVPGGPDLLTIDDVYEQLLVTMKAEGLPLPQRRTTRTAGLLALARNRASGSPVFSQPQDEPETTSETSLPIAGILEITENGAHVRTSGYQPGPNDVSVPASFLNATLRRGDVLTGAVPRGSEDQPLPELTRLDTVNGLDPDDSFIRDRPEFARFTPVHPNERLRLETDGDGVTTRLIDLICPIGKGQRGLIFADPRSGATTTLRLIADAIPRNDPDVHLMVVLANPRPEEVTELRRSIKGEVIPFDVTGVNDDRARTAEVAIERAKRLVELGHDVVFLLDSLTRLSRFPGLSPSLLDLFRSARRIEHGSSLTVMATLNPPAPSAPHDHVMFIEELKDAANLELHLTSDLAGEGLFPAIDVHASGTRNEDLLISPEELKALRGLRASLRDKSPQSALEDLARRIQLTDSNDALIRDFSN